MLRILAFGMSPKRGGVQTYLINLYEKIDKEKFQIDFVVQGENCFCSDQVDKIYYVTPRRESVVNHVKDLYLLFKENHMKYDIVYLNYSVLFFPIEFYLAKFFKIPHIITHAHLTKPSELKLSREISHYINRPIVRRFSSYLFSCSNMAAEWMFGSKSLTLKNYKIIKNAIYPEKFAYNNKVRKVIRKKLGIQEDAFVIGNVSRFVYQKNHEFILKIFYEVFKKNRNAILLLVGDGELRKNIEKQIDDLGIIDNVILTGSRSDIPDLLQAMDVFLFPSRYEGFGISLLEAQANGLKTFASSNVIPEEVKVTNLIDFISLNKCPEYWAEVILQYSKGYDRYSRIEEIKLSGFDINDQVNIFENLLLRL